MAKISNPLKITYLPTSHNLRYFICILHRLTELYKHLSGFTIKIEVMRIRGQNIFKNLFYSRLLDDALGSWDQGCAVGTQKLRLRLLDF
jgi:hypothetical protein